MTCIEDIAMGLQIETNQILIILGTRYRVLLYPERKTPRKVRMDTYHILSKVLGKI